MKRQRKNIQTKETRCNYIVQLRESLNPQSSRRNSHINVPYFLNYYIIKHKGEEGYLYINIIEEVNLLLTVANVDNY